MRLGLVTLTIVAAIGCSDALIGKKTFDELGAWRKSVDAINSSFNRAITTLDLNSGQWQATLKSLERELIDVGVPELARQVHELTVSTVAAVNVEFRCDVDFLGKRLSQTLAKIKAAVLAVVGKDARPPVYSPTFCQTVPSVIQSSALKLDVASPTAGNSSVIRFFGYDVNSYRDHLQAFLVDSMAGLIPVTDSLSQPSNYEMALNTQRIPISSCSATSISLRWDGRETYSIPIVHASRTSADCIQANNQEYANSLGACTDARINYDDYNHCWRSRQGVECERAKARGPDAAVGHWCSSGGEGWKWAHDYCSGVQTAKANWANDNSPGRAACLAGKLANLTERNSKCPQEWVCSADMRRSVPAVAAPSTTPSLPATMNKDESDALDDYIRPFVGPRPVLQGEYPAAVCSGDVRLRFVAYPIAATKPPLSLTEPDLLQRGATTCRLSRIPPLIFVGATSEPTVGDAKWSVAMGTGATAHCGCMFVRKSDKKK